MPESVRSLIQGTKLKQRKGLLKKLAKLPSEAEQLEERMLQLDSSPPSVQAEVNVPNDSSSEQPCEPQDSEDTESEDASEEEEGETQAITAVALVERALQPLEDWFFDACSSPAVENRMIEAASALTHQANVLIDGVASATEQTKEDAPYAARARRVSREVEQLVPKVAGELLLVAECDCGEGCSKCGFSRGFAAVDLAKKSGRTPP